MAEEAKTTSKPEQSKNNPPKPDPQLKGMLRKSLEDEE
jgi:hypothetical protein